MRDFKLRQEGFSLIELLIVMALTGVVAAALLGLLNSTQRTATTTDEVMEVQQNIRFGLDQIVRDLRMSGFMIPRDQRALDLAEEQMMTIRTGSAENRAARISNSISLTGDDVVNFTIANPEMAGLFSDGDRVRILRPPNQAPPVDRLLTVDSISSDPPQMALSGIEGHMVDIINGDMIVHTGVNDINTLTYCLEPDPNCAPLANPPCPTGQICLKRVININVPGVTPEAEIVSSLIAPNNGLAFVYFDEGGSLTADLDEIRAVGVTISGQTVATVNLSGQPKVRRLESYVRLRNR